MAPHDEPALEAEQEVLAGGLDALEDPSVDLLGNPRHLCPRVRRLDLEALADKHLETLRGAIRANLLPASCQPTEAMAGNSYRSLCCCRRCGGDDLGAVGAARSESPAVRLLGRRGARQGVTRGRRLAAHRPHASRRQRRRVRAGVRGNEPAPERRPPPTCARPRARRSTWRSFRSRFSSIGTIRRGASRGSPPSLHPRAFAQATWRHAVFGAALGPARLRATAAARPGAGRRGSRPRRAAA